MNGHRVVVTGVGVVSPIGHSLEEASRALREGRHGIGVMADWARVEGLETRLAGVVRDLDVGSHPRKKIRSMGRVGLLSLSATERAIADASLDPAELTTGRAGLIYGSTHGSSEAMEVFCRDLFSRYSLSGLSGSAYLKFMSHTCAANLAQYYGVRGRVVPTCAACASGSLAVGTAYELIRSGTQDVCLAGGAEEMHFVHAAVFDMMYAASRGYNDRPDESPRPFDVDATGWSRPRAPARSCSSATTARWRGARASWPRSRATDRTATARTSPPRAPKECPPRCASRSMTRASKRAPSGT